MLALGSLELMTVRLPVGSTMCNPIIANVTSCPVDNTMTVLCVLLGSIFGPAIARGIQIGYRDVLVSELVDGDYASKTYAAPQRRSFVCLAVLHRRNWGCLDAVCI